MPTRRAFVLAGGMFAAGVSLGGACGYAAGASASANAGATGEPEIDVAAGLLPTGDSDLDELRTLALKAPIEDLVRQHPMFVERVRASFHSDAFLWHGVERLVNGILADQHRQWPTRTRQSIIQVIEGMDTTRAPMNAIRLRERLPDLQRAR